MRRLYSRSQQLCGREGGWLDGAWSGHPLLWPECEVPPRSFAQFLHQYPTPSYQLPGQHGCGAGLMGGGVCWFLFLVSFQISLEKSKLKPGGEGGVEMSLQRGHRLCCPAVVYATLPRARRAAPAQANSGVTRSGRRCRVSVLTRLSAALCKCSYKRFWFRRQPAPSSAVRPRMLPPGPAGFAGITPCPTRQGFTVLLAVDVSVQNHAAKQRGGKAR